MPKAKTVFFCQNCGAQSVKWIGRCPSCGEWNTYMEEVIQQERRDDRARNVKPQEPRLISDIDWSDQHRISMVDRELDRVLGGGLVPGSLVLIGGEPGIGKSTLMMQVALRMEGKRILYVSGEESDQQLRMRADRLGIRNRDLYILTETSVQSILHQIGKIKPDLVVVDSVQTLQTDAVDSSPGSVSQVRECTSELQKLAKTSGIPVFLIGHITKEGYLAGPKVLEHMVDTVLQFEGDRHHMYRILRATKNRFGSVSELGIYEMQSSGLREVANPSEILLSQRDEQLSGVVIAATIEGLRPMLIETQALVSSAAYGTPQRSATGFDVRRMNMLLAVLEKRCGFRLGMKDVFLNIAGGIRVDDPAIDLAVICAVLSSNADIPVDKNVCFAAEVGLSGEIRAVNRIEARILEAEKLGFGKIVVSGYNIRNLHIKKFSIQVIPFRRIEEVYTFLFG
ncbi:MAG: DNA repair protein RadA [Bacteroidales bacterium]|nr:DNA repair protein RadA [Bacteroidales bacterium]